MRKVILNLAISLDGFIEGPNGEYDWCMTDQDYGMKEFLQRTDAIFFGRKSYELLMKYEKNPYPDKRKYVVSKEFTTTDVYTEVIRGNIEPQVRDIKNQRGKDIWLFGGAQLTTFFINAGLVDELQLSIHPLLLGKGKPLFSEINDRTQFTLIDTKKYDTGMVQLFYKLA